VGNVCHVGTAPGRCQERLTRTTSPFPPTVVIPSPHCHSRLRPGILEVMDPRLREDDEAAGIPGQPGRGAEGARFSWAAMSSRVAGAKNVAMWARLCKSFFG
jgi:hypothetical protein